MPNKPILKTYLIADDQEAVRDTLSIMLDLLKVETVLTAKDGQEALDIIQNPEHKVDVILCDWNMPNVSGIEVLKEVRKDKSNLPFVIITGRGDAESMQEAEEFGVTDYILKPFSLDELKEKIQTFEAA